MPAGPKPGQIIVEGDLGPAGVLVGLARAAGIAVCAREGAGLIRLDRTTLALTDGRTATERMASDRSPNVLFDLALDYATASRMAITRADQADEEAIAEAAGFFQALGKNVSVVDDAPGLVVMRTVAMLANEAADVVHQGVANAVDVDVAMLKGVNYPRGPLAWADDVGPARISRVIDALARAYSEDRYRNSPLLHRRALAAFPFTNRISDRPMTREAFICDAVRTPIGRYAGALSSVRADDLAAIPISALMARHPELDWQRLDDVILGCANQAGEDNRDVARMASLLAGSRSRWAGATVNRFCGSGLEAVAAAARAISAGEGEFYIAGGVENMSRSPFVVPKAEDAFSRQAEIHDTTIGWRFVNPEDGGCLRRRSARCYGRERGRASIR